MFAVARSSPKVGCAWRFPNREGEINKKRCQTLVATHNADGQHNFQTRL